MSSSCNSGPELVAAALFARVRSVILRIGGITILIAVCALAGSSPRAATQATPAPSPERVCGVCCCQNPDFCPLGQTCPTFDPCFIGVRCDVATQTCKQTFVPNGVPCDNNACPNIRSDPNNCGACDAVCPSSGAGTLPVCRNGKCQVVTVPFAANDVAPPTSAGFWNTEPSGRIIGIEGNDAALYAISVDGSMWKSTNSAPWVQLPNAPPLSFSLAIDPRNPSHLVVGERDGLGPPRLNTAGAWESTDAGANWTKVFDSASQCPRFRESRESSQAVSSVQITPASTVLLGTSCGVWRKQSGKYTQVSFAPILSLVVSVTPPTTSKCPGPDDNGLCPPGCSITGGHVTGGVVVGGHCVKTLPGDTVVVGRLGAGSLIYSLDDGATWTRRDVPADFNPPILQGPGKCQTFAGFPEIAPDSDDQMALPFLSSNSGLAAFGTIAVLTGCPNAPPANNSRLIYLDLLTGKAWVQQTTQGDGRGTSGGVRFFRTIVNPAAPSVVGEGIDIFFSTTEEIQRATGLTTDQGNPVLAWGFPDFVCPRGLCSAPQPQDPIHFDIRSMTFDGTTQVAWLATDGGVFVRRNGTWNPQIEGLHTASIATLTVLPSPLGLAPRLAYSGVDNDAWYGNPFSGVWNHTSLGDTSWTAGDAGDPNFVIGARSLVLSLQGGPLEELHFFRSVESPPGAQIGGFSGYNDPAAAAFFGRNSVQIIQTLPSETPVDLLDAVSLVIPPITYGPQGQRQPANGPLGRSNPNPNGGPILLRTKKFAANPGVNIQNYCSPTSPWYPEVVNLPKNVIRVWPSRRVHSDPFYYVYDNVNVSKITCATGRGPNTNCGLGSCPLGETITPLDVGGTPLRISNDPSIPPSGPVFVDPYDPNHVFVATSDNGVTVSVDGGTTPFKPDPVLTALLTDSGHFPLLPQDQGRTSLNEVSFDHNRSHSVVASSPFTGAFWAADDERIWVALSPALSHPAVSVTDVGIDSASIYIGTQGRGIISVSGYQNGPIASYYDRTFSGGGITGTKLLRSDGKALAGALVSILVTQSDGTQTTQNVKTASDGLLKVTEPPPFSIVHLSFAGLPGVAPANTAFETGPTL